MPRLAELTKRIFSISGFIRRIRTEVVLKVNEQSCFKAPRMYSCTRANFYYLNEKVNS